MQLILELNLPFDQLDNELAAPRAIEFAEEDPLPGAQRELAVLDRDRFGRADEHRLQVGCGVPFGVAVVRVVEGNYGIDDV